MRQLIPSWINIWNDMTRHLQTGSLKSDLDEHFQESTTPVVAVYDHTSNKPLRIRIDGSIERTSKKDEPVE